MTDRLTLALELTADPSKLKAGLEIARRAILEQFQAAKAAVDGANKSLDEAQSHAQAMAQALRADGVEAQSFAAWMKGAAAAVREAKAAVQEKTLALQQARTAAQENAAAIEGATLAEWKAATAANFSAQLAAAQRLITAEETLRREVLATVAAREGAALAAERQAAAAFAAAQTAARGVSGQGIDASLGALGVRSTAAIRGEMASVQQALSGLKASGANANDVSRASAAAAASLAALRLELIGVGPATAVAGQSLGGLEGKLLAVATSVAAVQGAFALLKGTVTTGMNFQTLANQLAFANGGDVAQAGRELEFVVGTSNKLGLSLDVLARNYGKFGAAARASGLGAAQTREIFLATAEAASVLGLSGEELHDILIAIQQMASKGVIMSEELKHQLGDRLPGSFAIAAKAAGMTEQAFNKALEQGEILAGDFLPKFAAELRQAVAGSLPAAEDSMRALLSRLDNVWTDFKLRLAKAGVFDAVEAELRRFLNTMATMADSGELTGFVERLGALLGNAVAFLERATEAAIKFNGALIALAEYGAIALIGSKLAGGLGAATTAMTGAAGAAAVLGRGLSLLRGGLVGLAVFETVKELAALDERLHGASRAAEGYARILANLRATNAEYTAEVIKTDEAVRALGDGERQAYEKRLRGAETYYRAQAAQAAVAGNGALRDQLAEQANLYAAARERIAAVQRGMADDERTLSTTVLAVKRGMLAELKEQYAAQVRAYDKANADLQAAISRRKTLEADIEGLQSPYFPRYGIAKRAPEKKGKDSGKDSESGSDGPIDYGAKLIDVAGLIFEAERAVQKADSMTGAAAAKAAKFATQKVQQATDMAKVLREINERTPAEDRLYNDSDFRQMAKRLEEVARTATALDEKAAAAQLQPIEAAIDKLKAQAEALKQMQIPLNVVVDPLAIDAIRAAITEKLRGVPVVVMPVLPEAKQAEKDLGSLPLPSTLPGRAYGGALPGSAPHDRADNMLYWGTPGEWVMQRPAVRYYGPEFMAALNAMRLPKFADGGLIGRLRLPSLPASGAGAASPTPVHVHLDGRSFPMTAAPEVVAALVGHLGREALRKGVPR